ISKPTISESVRRLSEAGLLTDGGQQLGRRGPAGTLYRLRADVGVAVAASAGPDGVLVEVLDVRGDLLHRAHRPVAVPTTRSALEPLLLEAAAEALTRAEGPVLSATLSIAGPVDRATGRLVQLPDSPFLVDDLDPVPLLAPVLHVVPVVDNDVDWAALAERAEGSARGLDDFAYVFCGPGLGGALVSGGVVLHGGRGLAGEIAHVRTIGPGGRALRLVEVFAELGLRRTGSAALDLDLLRTVLDGSTPEDRAARDAVITALAGVIASVATMVDPQAVVIGGPWAGHAALAARLPAAVDELAAVSTEVRFAALGADAPQRGARRSAVQSARDALTSRLRVETPLPSGSGQQ
ncbi:MAG TPA: ROK family protein, partial [Microlunatus sp.]|nr:ROK family protein [Microlunatus sp.]